MRDPKRGTVEVGDTWLRKDEAAEASRRLAELLGSEEAVGALYRAMAQGFLAGLTTDGGLVGESLLVDALAYVQRRGAALVVNINEQTRKATRDLVDRAVEEGWSTHRLQEELQDGPMFSRDRALRIARTEAAFAMNDGESTMWQRQGVEFVEIVDGTEDEFCEHADGQIWTVQEFRANPIAHPNCRRRAIPLPGRPEPDEVGFSIDPPRPS